MIAWRLLLVGAGLAALGLAAVPLTGLLPHGAGEGAGPLGWYRWLTTRQSVALRSLTVMPPVDLGDPSRVARAAGHYEQACAPCHGSPDGPARRVAADIVPVPPALAGTRRWRPDPRLFQTLTHGLAGSAMPAWPTPIRPDEVWDMVAFLGALPELDAAAYRRLSGQDVAAAVAGGEGPALAASCAACHGPRGQGRDGIPRLDILPAPYIEGALAAFRAGTRASGPMMVAARRLTDGEIRDLATHFGAPAQSAGAAPAVEGETASPPARPAPAQGSVEAAATGQPIPSAETAEEEAARIARVGLPRRDVPACLSCHGPQARADHPRLDGQDERYLARQLDLFAEHGAARGGPKAYLMEEAVRGLTVEQRYALARWFSRR